MDISNALQDNITKLKDKFKEDSSLLFREFSIGGVGNIECLVVYIEGMVDLKRINAEILGPLLDMKWSEADTDIYLPSVLVNKITSPQLETTNEYSKLIDSLINGYTVILMDGYNTAILINTFSINRRDIDEPVTEKVVRGPRDGFNESLSNNLTLVRARLKSDNLKMKFKVLGKVTKTKVCICYLEDIASERIVREAERRLDEIDIDGILDSGYIQELISDDAYSPFGTIGYTERPDIVAGKLLEGRISILCEGSPFALTLPFLFIEFFQSNSNYYSNYYFGTFNRLLSILGFFLTTSVPAIYTALITFHQEMLPTAFILSISASRQGVPMPTIVEMLLILLVFELLREASLRIPSTIGQTISIVGILVVGQASVEAKLISAPIIIIAALTGITGFLVPKMEPAVIIVRLVFLLGSAFIGLYGYIFSMIFLFIHLTSMKSFGVPYMLYGSSLQFQDQKDVIIRAPWWLMKKRPRILAYKNMNRQKS